MRAIVAALSLALVFVLSSPAFAQCRLTNDGRALCNSPRTERATRTRHAAYTRYDAGTVVAHPAGCPRRAFCGCGVSVKVFGHSVRHLWPASAWLRFPRASPGPGMVAARNSHVMYIMAYHGDGTATVYDPNSGRGLTRIHKRSLAGFTIVNPRGSRLASR